MALKSQRSIQQVFRNPQIRQFMKGLYWFENVTDSGAGIAAGRLCEQTSNTIKLGTEQNSATLGVTRSAISASGKGNVQAGFVPVLAACALTKLDLLAPRASGYVGKYMPTQVTLLNAEAGGNFGNQPAGDGIEIVSDDAGDTTQTCTIYGTITGTTDSVTSETVTLTGTDAVATTIVTWQNILAVKLSASCAGTITIREASGDATVTTITTGNTSAGVATPATTQAYGLIPRHDASGAGTAPIAIIGTGIDGTALSVVDALNGTTEEDHATTPYGTISEIYIGAVASTVNVTVLTNESTESTNIGIVLGDSVSEGGLIDAYIKPYFV
jgi:hypothetical protein